MWLPIFFATISTADAYAHDVTNATYSHQDDSSSCSYEEGSWRALEQLTPYLSDLNLKRNFERTVEESQKLSSQLPTSDKLLASLECAGEVEESGDLCSEVVDLPISTAPTLFTRYQAKRAANAIFETVNHFYRRVDLQMQAEGRKHSSQPRKADHLRFLHSTDAIAIKQLLSPRLAISQFFGSPELLSLRNALKKQRGSRESNCKGVKSHGTSCERIPHDSFHGFKITSQPVASLPTLFTLLERLHESQSPRAPFPPIGALAHQRITDVALPPPQCEKSFSYCLCPT